MTNRRMFIAGLMIAPLAITAPAIARSPDVIDRYWSAFDGINKGLLSEEAYFAALDELHAFRPQTPQDFVRKFLCLWDEEGYPGEKILDTMIEDARRLGGGK